MPRDSKAYLYDMREAVVLIGEFTAGLDYDAYAANAMVRAAVERQFEIIGEALGQLSKHDPDTAGRISEHQVDDMLVWDMVGTRLEVLRREVDTLLSTG